jgi:hypothetical protein
MCFSTKIQLNFDLVYFRSLKFVYSVLFSFFKLMFRALYCIFCFVKRVLNKRVFSQYAKQNKTKELENVPHLIAKHETI